MFPPMSPTPPLSGFLLFFLIAILAAVHIAVAYPQMQFRVPNGDNIYREGRYSPALGHKDPSGDDPSQLNAFGMYMKVEGMHWTQQTCHGDADGDGYTNGEELGDPDCVWASGMIPARTTDISHPGYADSTPKTFKSASQRLYEEMDVVNAAMVEEAARLGGSLTALTPIEEEQLFGIHSKIQMDETAAALSLDEAEIESQGEFPRAASGVNVASESDGVR